MSGCRVGLWMKKVGTTAIFDPDTGSRVPVTLLFLEDTVVVGTKVASVQGYNAIVLGYKSSSSCNKPQAKSLEALGLDGNRKLFESRVSSIEGEVSPGSNVYVDHFVKGQFIDVTGKTIGKGFAGVMKRHNFAGLRASHGVSISHRSQGSTGQCQDPGRVFKGKKMAGHMGNNRVTVQNLQVLTVDKEESLLVVKGTSVPGHNGSYVFVRDAVKRPAPRDGLSFVSVAS